MQKLPSKQITSLDDLLTLPSPAAYLSLPASGTSWMCRAMYEAGRPIHHEHYRRQNFRKQDKDLMTFKFTDKDLENRTFRYGIHAPKAGPFTDFRCLAYQVRNPLKQVYSMSCLDTGSTITQVSDVCGGVPNISEDNLGWCIALYVAFHERAKKYADVWFRVEDMEWSLPHIVFHNKCMEPSWEELKSLDPTGTALLQKIHEELGYGSRFNTRS